MGKPIFCIIGESGSGKSTYLDAFMKTSFAKDNEIIELKYHTTRSKRSPEEDSYYFTTYEEYEVDAENENEALNEAERELRSDRSIPIVDTHYDEKDIEKIED